MFVVPPVISAICPFAGCNLGTKQVGLAPFPLGNVPTLCIDTSTPCSCYDRTGLEWEDDVVTFSASKPIFTSRLLLGRKSRESISKNAGLSTTHATKGFVPGPPAMGS